MNQNNVTTVKAGESYRATSTTGFRLALMRDGNYVVIHVIHSATANQHRTLRTRHWSSGSRCPRVLHIDRFGGKLTPASIRSFLNGNETE